LGTDAAVYPHGLDAHELAVYVSLGMTPLQAIQTATINDADLLGWGRLSFGTLPLSFDVRIFGRITTAPSG
jgi:imidazolonepropionase-like amidohydrolase